MKFFTKSILLLLITIIILNSCASTTVINSIPEDKVKVYLNDSYVGITPYKLRDTKILGTRTEVILKKEGYEDFYTSITKDGRLHVGALIGGFIFWFPFIWLFQYEKEYNFEMEQE